MGLEQPFGERRKAVFVGFSCVSWIKVLVLTKVVRLVQGRCAATRNGLLKAWEASRDLTVAALPMVSVRKAEP